MWSKFSCRYEVQLQVLNVAISAHSGLSRRCVTAWCHADGLLSMMCNMMNTCIYAHAYLVILHRCIYVYSYNYNNDKYLISHGSMDSICMAAQSQLSLDIESTYADLLADQQTIV